MLEKINGSGNYLDYKVLNPKTHISKIAKLHSFKVDVSKETMKNYAILHFRDKNQAHVMGSIFDIESLDEASIKLRSLKGNLVRVNALVGIFGDRYTLNISSLDNVEPIVDEEAEKVFSSRIESVNELSIEIEGVYSSYDIGFKFSIMWEFSSADKVYDGKVGGIVKLWHDVIRTSTSYYSSVGIYPKLFLQCIHVAMEIFSTKVTVESKMGFIDDYSIYKKINSYESTNVFKEEDFPVAFDVMTTVAGLSAPAHPYSHLIKIILDGAMNAQIVTSALPSMILGEKMEIGGRTLSLF